MDDIAVEGQTVLRRPPELNHRSEVWKPILACKGFALVICEPLVGNPNHTSRSDYDVLHPHARRPHNQFRSLRAKHMVQVAHVSWFVSVLLALRAYRVFLHARLYERDEPVFELIETHHLLRANLSLASVNHTNPLTISMRESPNSLPTRR